MAEITDRFRIVGENATQAAFRAAIRDSESAAARMQSAFKRAFGAISLLSIGRSFISTVQFHDELARGAVQSGIAAKAYTELAFAARQADVDHAALATSLKKMQVTLSEASSGGKAQIATLRALGLSFQELRSLAPDRQFERIAEQIRLLKDPADRTRAAVEVFGKAGADLLPLFERGAEGIRKARDEAVRFNQSLTELDLKKLEQADQAIKQMAESWQGLKTSFATWAAQDASEVADKLSVLFGTASEFQELEVRIRDLRREASSPIPLFFNFGYIDGAPVIMGPQAIESWITRLTVAQRKLRIESEAGSKPVAPPGFAGSQLTPEEAAKRRAAAIELEVQAMRDLSEAQRQAGRLLQPLGDTPEANAAAIAETMRKINEENTEARSRAISLGDAFQLADDSAAELMKTLQDEGARRAVGFISDAIMGLDDGARDFAAGMVGAFRRILADEAAQKLFALLSGRGGGGGGLLSAIASGIGTLFGVGGGVSSGGSGSGGFRGLAAHGMSLDPGEWAIAGEAGPEPVFAGRSGATIVPFAKSGRGGAAPVVNVTIAPVNHIDARGASVELINRLPAILAENSRRTVEQAEMRIVDGLRRGKYDLA